MKKIIKKIFIIIAFLILFLLLLPKNHSGLTEIEMLLFGIIGLISIYEIADDVSQKSYSLNLMHWLFILFFFFISPVIQLSYSYYPWGIYQSSNEIINSCILVIIWIFSYKFGSYFTQKFKFKINIQIKSSKVNSISFSLSTINKITMTLLSFASFLLLAKIIGFSNMFARQTASASLSANNSKMIQLLLTHCTRAIITYNFAALLINYFNTKKGILIVIINGILLLLGCFPTGMARNMAANIYLGILIVFFYKNVEKNKNSFKYLFMFIVSFMIIFPAINAFRRTNLSGFNIIETFNSVIDNVSENYLSGDYDAFSIIGDTKTYVETNGITNGRQLLGSLLFFVPRSIWNFKPRGSGELVFSSLRQYYVNVSSPIVSEAYINFGVFGIVVFGFLYSLAVTKVDEKYWKIYNDSNNKNYTLFILYPFLLPSFFFMLRGDLQSTTAYMSAIIAIFIILDKIVIKPFSIKEKSRGD